MKTIFGEMKVIYDDIKQVNGMTYHDFEDELIQKLNAYSTTSHEYYKKAEMWKNIYGRAFTVVFAHQALIETAFSISPFGVKQEKVLCDVANHTIDVREALRILHGEQESANPLGSAITSKLAENIVAIANQFEIFKEHLSVSSFNSFLAGTLSEPLRSANNVAVSLFLQRLVKLHVLTYGAYEKIGAQHSILSSSGKKALNARDIASSLYAEEQKYNSTVKPIGKFRHLKKELLGLNTPK